MWRQDFPLTSAGEDDVTRREFVRYLVLASGGFAAGNVGVALWSSLRSLNEGSPYTLPGIRLKTGPRDAFIISQNQLQRFNNGGWTTFGPIVDGRPRG